MRKINSFRKELKNCKIFVHLKIVVIVVTNKNEKKILKQIA